MHSSTCKTQTLTRKHKHTIFDASVTGNTPMDRCSSRKSPVVPLNSYRFWYILCLSWHWMTISSDYCRCIKLSLQAKSQQGYCLSWVRLLILLSEIRCGKPHFEMMCLLMVFSGLQSSLGRIIHIARHCFWSTEHSERVGCQASSTYWLHPH